MYLDIISTAMAVTATATESLFLKWYGRRQKSFRNFFVYISQTSSVGFYFAIHSSRNGNPSANVFYSTPIWLLYVSACIPYARMSVTKIKASAMSLEWNLLFSLKIVCNKNDYIFSKFSSFSCYSEWTSSYPISCMYFIFWHLNVFS